MSAKSRALLAPLAAAILAAMAVAPVAGAGVLTDFRAQPQPVPPHLEAPPRAPWSATLLGERAVPAATWRISSDPDAPRTASSPPPFDYGRDAAARGQAGPAGRIELRLQQGHFDPRIEAPPVLPALAGASHGPAAGSYHLVQFRGPVRASWQAELRARDLEIIDYVPDFAYIVRAPGPSPATLAGWDAVRWSGPLLPAHRLAANLAEPALRASAARTEELLVRAFPGEPLAAVTGAIEATGARILGRAEDAGGGAIITVRVPETGLLALASLQAVAWIERRPRWQLMNSVARGNQLLGKDLVESVAGFYGEGQIAAITDTGLSSGNPNTVHPDFAGRVLAAAAPGSCGTWTDYGGHGTHVAGSTLGSGVLSGSNPAAGHYTGSHAGIAPRAGIVVWATCEDFSGIPESPYAAYWQQLYELDPRLRTNNNSWGNPEELGTYNMFTRETDRFLADHPDMVAVFAAGNSGIDADWDGVSDQTTSSTPSTGKNVISVAMTESLRQFGGYNPDGPCGWWGECWPDNFPVNPIAMDRISDHPNGMAAMSGRGPTLSGRLKPDIAAPGSNIVSAASEYADPDSGWGIWDAAYIFNGGTSMAAPMVSGGVAVVRQLFDEVYAHNPSSALVRAVLFNAATDMSPGQYGWGPQQDVWNRPDINQGWGRMNLVDSVLITAIRRAEYYELFPGLVTGQVSEIPVTLRAGGAPLRITLAWTDAPGIEASHGALVNDLDLEVVDPHGNTHYGFAGLVGQPRDRYNNAEEVALAAAPGGSYTVRVRAWNVPAGPQPYALVVSGDLAEDNDVIFANGFD